MLIRVFTSLSVQGNKKKVCSLERGSTSINWALFLCMINSRSVFLNISLVIPNLFLRRDVEPQVFLDQLCFSLNMLDSGKF